ncbi:MAG: type I-E CRISPR-associated protein Cse2/CasB [Paracoccus sp. (in: a-proteobacteria)]|uniref:type I-E CRISPR-associated protein Cse2/CasB n=1 Tax=Paracoccus sp. TaxID=267 RepID=UPI0026DEE78A|nr:type I-E CRISPR-associated protein Cse2/CasB [Paracoccus sp. (in: a-proteobacteria)]MDO5614390.1 type I-E CRISPR-associated protein Cse2/CasB [Paracoccus sp. (in: a-proteobacteria)]
MSVDSLDIGQIIRNWWAANLADRQSGAARGLAARLRRAQGIEALAEPAVQDLAQRLGTRDALRLIALVKVLAELRGESGATLARRLGGREPALSTARFQRLMRSDRDALTTALIRAIRSLPDPACNIAALGRDLWFWNDKTRARWSFDYFAAPIPEKLKPAEATP